MDLSHTMEKPTASMETVVMRHQAHFAEELCRIMASAMESVNVKKQQWYRGRRRNAATTLAAGGGGPRAHALLYIQ